MDCDLEKIRGFFAADQFAAHAGIEIESASEEEVVCGMEVTPGHLNASGRIQGGAIFTLADVAFGVHSNLRLALGEDAGLTVAQSCSISYLRKPEGGRLTAFTSRLSHGAHMSVYRIAVRDAYGNLVAEMHGNGFTIWQHRGG
ncbi:MAG: PaaI family thioesterase [Desulfovibrio sp.]|jgi:acyl-CoA thioesterase|nr:PaaI family thioesterase [Desulfovibrio sp.]